MQRVGAIVAAGIAAVLTSLALGVGTASAWGTTGEYVGGEATCDPAYIYARPAVMKPVPISSSGSVSALNGSQWVAFRAHLTRWNGSQWVIVASGHWKGKELALSNDYSLSFSEDWFYDYSTGTSGSGVTWFPVTLTGGYYYRVSYDLYWFPTSTVADGGLSVWASGHVDRRTNVYDLGGHPYCRY